MRRLLLLAAGLLAVAVIEGDALGAERTWVVGGGGGPLYPNTTDWQWLGRGYSLSAASSLRPWFQFGGELSWYRIDGSEYDDYSWSDYRYRTEPWDAIVPAATFRVQPPVRKGLAPFVGASSGISWSTGGDTVVLGPGYPRGHVNPGPNETVWASSIELGLRVVLPGAWPDPEVAIRSVAWIGDDTRKIIQPRIALFW